MKTSFKIILLIVCALGLSRIAYAGNNTYSIGVEDLDYFPYYANDNNEYTGFSRELFDMFSREYGYTFKYQKLPVKRLLEEFLSLDVDFKFPDNPHWKINLKNEHNIVYSNSVVDYIDGTLVLHKNKGRGIKAFKTLGIIRGFTAWDYLDYLSTTNIELVENSSFSGLLRQVNLGRIDGIYCNIVAARYKIEDVFNKPYVLIFDPGLPYSKNSYMLSSIKHQKIIREINSFMVKKKRMIDSLKKKYKIPM